MASFLSRLRNKSEFVRTALLRHMDLACPLCHTTGTVARGVALFYADLIATATCFCDNAVCASAAGQRAVLPLPTTLSDTPVADVPRIQQFLLGGELFCPTCYGMTPVCEACEWRVSVKETVSHMKTVHGG